MAKQVSPGVLALRKVVDDVYADAREAKKQGKLVGWSSSKFPCELAEAFDLNVMYPENQAAGIAAQRDGEIMCQAAEDLGFDNDICGYARISLAYAGAKIKWVNDLYLCGKKICGILTETVKIAEYNYIMIGVGINLTTIDFPDDIRHKAGAIGVTLDKDKTIAAICDNLSRIADAPFATDYLEYYRKNMMGIGETITYSEKGQERTAKIEGINDLGALLVIEGDEQKCLCSGEITITSIATDSR